MTDSTLRADVEEALSSDYIIAREYTRDDQLNAG